MEHSFDIDIAKAYGVPAAVLLKHLHYWIEKNRANEKNFYDGNYWTYNSKKAFAELFPYMTARQIDYALQKLIDDGLIITGNYNKVAYDRTLWYAITKKGYCILQNCKMENTKAENAIPEIVEPIPNKNTDTDKQIKNKDIYISILTYLNEKSGMNYKHSSKATQGHINARIAEGYAVEDFYTVIDKKCDEWRGTDFEKYLRPSTLFGSKFENYLNAPAKKKNSGIIDDYERMNDIIDTGGLFD